MEAPPPAITTVRGFHATPVTSGDEDSDYGVGGSINGSGGSASVRRSNRKQRITVLDDVVSANCSPVLRPAGSPAVSGIAKLRMQVESLSLDTSATSSRASSPVPIPTSKSRSKPFVTRETEVALSRTIRLTSTFLPDVTAPKLLALQQQQQQQQPDPAASTHHKSSDSQNDDSSSTSRLATGSSRSNSHDVSSNTSADEAGPGRVARNGSTRYVINLENDFVSESVGRESVRWTIEDGLVSGDANIAQTDANNTVEAVDVEAFSMEVDKPASSANLEQPEENVAASAASGVDATAGTGAPAAEDDKATTETASASTTNNASNSAPRKKMTADDFEPLRCLGKGSYGTVLLVKQNSTGRLYAQKQFKKASLVVHKKLIEQTKTERQILESVNRHPFVVKLYYAFQDREKLYLILEYGQGGELFTHLSAERMFSEPTAAFYMAEMVLALSHLHDTLGVVYRDLKPENCLLDAEGHLLLTDFGLSKVALPGCGGAKNGEDSDDSCCHSMLGTVEYMAPEVVQGKKYGRAVDWWSFGALGYDLLTGHPPFRGRNNAKIQENIVKQKLVLPYFLSPDAKDLLTRLLRKDPRKRLGAHMPKDLATMKAHRYFRRINWEQLAARQLEPPIQPVITDPELAENFAPEFTELALSPVMSPISPASGMNGGAEGNHRSAMAMAMEGRRGSRGGMARSPVAMRGRRGTGTDGAGSSFKDDPFGGFSFVASTSLLNDNNFPMMA